MRENRIGIIDGLLLLIMWALLSYIVSWENSLNQRLIIWSFLLYEFGIFT